MSTFATTILFVMFLLDPHEKIDAEAAAAVSRDADRVELSTDSPVQADEKGVKSARIRSRESDFDRQEGVVYFEGDVIVDYADDYTMLADRLYVFLAGSNALSRVVALGNVVITNETRIGTCEMATYRRARSEIEMFGDGQGRLARLREEGQDASEVEGDRIRFWIDSEQVEVENSRLSAEQQQKGKANFL